MSLPCKPLPLRPDLEALLAKAKEQVDKMTPGQLADMFKAQRRSYVLGEAGMGSDADEAEYREALFAKDEAKIAELDAQAKERQRLAAEALDRMGF